MRLWFSITNRTGREYNPRDREEVISGYYLDKCMGCMVQYPYAWYVCSKYPALRATMAQDLWKGEGLWDVSRLIGEGYTSLNYRISIFFLMSLMELTTMSISKPFRY